MKSEVITFDVPRKIFLNSNKQENSFVKREKKRQLRAMSGEYKPDKQHKYNPDNPCIVTVEVFTPTRRIFDPPNAWPTVKPLLDGLTDAGLWTDDNYSVIIGTNFEYGGLSGTKDLFKIKLTINETDRRSVNVWE